MILEGVVTTTNPDQSMNVSPMGPKIDAFSRDSDLQRFVLRPFQTSTTYQNLKRSAAGVLHVTDDVLLIAKAAVGKLAELPPTRAANVVEGFVLADACRWYEFKVERLDDAEERTTIECNIVERGRIRDFWGFNRAKHAVIEAAILATRVGIIPDSEIVDGIERLKVLVEKTGGAAEHEAFRLLDTHVRNTVPSES